MHEVGAPLSGIDLHFVRRLRLTPPSHALGWRESRLERNRCSAVFFLDQTARLICTSPFRMNSGASAVESEILTLAGFCLVDNWFFLLKLRRDSSGSNSVGRMPASHSGSLS